MKDFETGSLERLRASVAGVMAKPGEAGCAEAAIRKGVVARRPSVAVRCGSPARYVHFMPQYAVDCIRAACGAEPYDQLVGVRRKLDLESAVR